MSTITQKKKLSKGTWALIIILLAAIVAVAVLAVIGYISLAFLADWLVGTMMFGSAGWVNATLVLVTPFILGLLLYYIAVKYFIGNKVTNTGVQQGYSPTPVYPSQTQKDTETVIS